MNIQSISEKAQMHGLLVRGGFEVEPDDAVPMLSDGSPARTLILLGNAGSSLWTSFSDSPELKDGQEHPLDRWSRRVGDRLAAEFGADVYYPFGGPPYQPFIRWAKKAEELQSSTLGLLMHPVYGLWHAYRMALAFPYRVASVTGVSTHYTPACQSCEVKPCLSSCPVDAFSDDYYDVNACVSYLDANPQAVCLRSGCMARMSCPEGATYRYEVNHAAFHMKQFVMARLRTSKNDNDQTIPTGY